MVITCQIELISYYWAIFQFLIILNKYPYSYSGTGYKENIKRVTTMKNKAEKSVGMVDTPRSPFTNPRSILMLCFQQRPREWGALAAPLTLDPSSFFMPRGPLEMGPSSRTSRLPHFFFLTWVAEMHGAEHSSLRKPRCDPRRWRRGDGPIAMF